MFPGKTWGKGPPGNKEAGGWNDAAQEMNKAKKQAKNNVYGQEQWGKWAVAVAKGRAIEDLYESWIHL